MMKQIVEAFSNPIRWSNRTCTRSYEYLHGHKFSRSPHVNVCFMLHGNTANNTKRRRL
ncbi:uncharacterized protein FOMMEDRAFT_22841 [Fomitiporia mediterranea MF3/22]|uniref:uncharacterized protein n=1 Tax=Fomitiporia mediterranea (strain MF3/22) TaxID=694068 RepID=UPI00044075D4|nr:uncharacterized protein FOMMEDRAFT_22841 [Fomitiporia mediterranea MF3/22]EJC99751.1 hypothetical protein FOMMEDRAFT_22841 [Fomitiporia mediterranea MF3/22]